MAGGGRFGVAQRVGGHADAHAPAREGGGALPFDVADQLDQRACERHLVILEAVPLGLVAAQGEDPAHAAVQQRVDDRGELRAGGADRGEVHQGAQAGLGEHVLGDLDDPREVAVAGAAGHRDVVGAGGLQMGDRLLQPFEGHVGACREQLIAERRAMAHRSGALELGQRRSGGHGRKATGAAQRGGRIVFAYEPVRREGAARRRRGSRGVTVRGARQTDAAHTTHHPVSVFYCLPSLSGRISR